MNLYTVIPDLVWEGRGLLLKLQLPKNLITTWLKKSIVILFQKSEMKSEFNFKSSNLKVLLSKSSNNKYHIHYFYIYEKDMKIGSMSS